MCGRILGQEIPRQDKWLSTTLSYYVVDTNSLFLLIFSAKSLKKDYFSYNNVN